MKKNVSCVKKNVGGNFKYKPLKNAFFGLG